MTYTTVYAVVDWNGLPIKLRVHDVIAGTTHTRCGITLTRVEPAARQATPLCGHCRRMRDDARGGADA